MSNAQILVGYYKCLTKALENLKPENVDQSRDHALSMLMCIVENNAA